jgi:hypothetical protein
MDSGGQEELQGRFGSELERALEMFENANGEIMTERKSLQA